MNVKQFWKQASPFNMNNSGDPVQSVIQECPTAPQSLRGRRTIVMRREGRIKILSTRTHPFGMSMAVSEFSNGVSNLHFPVSKAEDNYKLFCHKYWCSGQGTHNCYTKDYLYNCQFIERLCLIPSSFLPPSSLRELSETLDLDWSSSTHSFHSFCE